MSDSNKIEPVLDEGGKWRWAATSVANGQRVGVSGESFDSHSNAERAVADFLRGLPLVDVLRAHDWSDMEIGAAMDSKNAASTEE